MALSEAAEPVFLRSSPSVWMICNFPIIALSSFVDIASIADSADFDRCDRLDKNHAPVADPQPGARPPCEPFDIARSTDTGTPELRRLCPLFAGRTQEGRKHTGLGRTW
jgi:hypothetical protein